MKQAQEMQKQLAQAQEKLRSLEVEGQAGSGSVKLTISGEGKLLSLKIEPEVLNDVDLVEDLIFAAYNQAWQTLEAQRGQEMKTMDIKLPPGLGGLF